MTLIITALAKNKVVQASDRRLTRDGSLCDDRANKAVCVDCNNAIFSVAYTGIAYIGRKRTDEWIADYFDSIPDIGLKPIHEIQRELTDYATAAFAWYRTPPLLIMVLAGFHLTLQRPFIMHILNANVRQTPCNIISEPPSNTFRDRTWIMEQNADKKTATIVWLDGLSAVAHPRTLFGRIVRKRLRKTRKYSAYMDHYEVADNLVSAIRLAHRHPEYGHAIGRDVLVMIHDIAVEEYTYSEARHYAMGSAPDTYVPHLFSPRGNQRGTFFPSGVIPYGAVWLNTPA